MPRESPKSADGERLHALFREVFALHAALSEEMDAVHERAGMRTSQVRVASALDRMGAATVPDVAAALKVSRQFVQTVCNELLAQGILEFEDNPRHRRSKLARLTATGRDVLYRTKRQEARIIEQLLPGIDARAVEQAVDLLSGIRRRIGHT
jgi:DNA-binding MarR family transcriptional regulator